MPSDPYSPQQIAAQKGMPHTVEMGPPQPGGVAGIDPAIAQMMSSTQQRAAAKRLQELQLAELEREQQMEASRARAERAKNELEAERAEAETEELQARLREIRDHRGKPDSQGSGGLVEMLLSRMMEQQTAAQQEVSQLREKMTESLSQQLADFRRDMQRQIGRPEGERPPASQLADQIGQLTELRNVLAEFLPRPQMTAAGGDIDLTIRQIELQHRFEIERERLQMERERQSREWEEERERRRSEVQLREQELLLKQERNDRLGGMLERVTPRLADALSGMGVAAAPSAPPPMAGGGPPMAPAAPPPAAGPASPRETVPDTGGNLHCLDCGTVIPVKQGDTELTCSGCGRTYSLQHHPD